MNSGKTPEYFQNLNYDVILKKKGSQYVLCIPELSCLVEDESLEEAYRKLEIEKNQYIKKTIDLGFSHLIKEPIGIRRKQRLFSELIPFGIKFLLVLLIVIMVHHLLMDVINDSPKIAKGIAKELLPILK